MAYDEGLARRVRDVLATRTSFRETRMMGGLVFMVDDAMCCGVTGEALLVRVGEAERDNALREPHTRRMEFGGRSPRGFIFVDAAGCATKTALTQWVSRALAFVATLPPKKTTGERQTARRVSAKKPATREK